MLAWLYVPSYLLGVSPDPFCDMAPLFEPYWKHRDGSNTVYERPLGLTELGFYWDSIFDRTADTLQHAGVEVHPKEFQEAVSPSNIARTWVDLKLQYPLLGAQLEERDEHSIFFVISEDLLRACRPGEITFKKISSQQEAVEIVHRIIVKEKRLSESLLASIHILERTDLPNHFHLLIHVAHIITDGMANITILKTFLDRLCKASPPVPDIKQRLALSVASEDLVPQRNLSIAKRRWRRAISRAIATNRNSRKLGGHTLPRKISSRTPYTPAYSMSATSSFSPEDSKNIILNCRKNRLTFGNAYPVLAQIALTRVLLRRYLRGEIDEAEWEFRKREPMSSAGPVNLRPLLDKGWIEEGGLTNVSLAISFFFFSLPFMPLGSATNLRPGDELPSFGCLLSEKRFLLRSKAIQIQAANYTKHPLFQEFAEIYFPGRIQRAKESGLQWRNESEPPKHLSDKPLSPMEQALSGLVHCNGGSSMGNMDLWLPRKYPLLGQKENNDPLVLLKSSTTKLRCRPTELYLGAATRNKQLHLWTSWDGNVYEEDLVKEWLEDVKQATKFYLGRSINPHALL
ncbi:hypothetical protein CPB84DRAFT_1763081 [Gymnopilus junonius]|uniref:Condensation domain-containing protein n=1 Tax=Gymnopilus junonius TaxID=109634 RepID=A0A9P5NYL0_GYMJU|nr:hypothetical protein CPB84DRAFT_1763081 [Gymnopilus junonius]